MSYGGYGGYDDGGYGDNNRNPPNPYGSPNTYGSPNANAYGSPNAYTSPRPNAPYQSPGTHEMATFGRGNDIREECEAIVDGVRQIENDMERLKVLQKQHINDTDTSGQSETKRNVDLLTQSIMDQYRSMADRLREVVKRPESRQRQNEFQVGRAERKIKDTIQKFQEQESAYRKDMKAQMERQIRIVRPDATDAEIRDALQDASSPVFQQAVMQSNRTAQANRVLDAVKQRHQEMLKIEQQLAELLDLLSDMNELLAKQEATVMEIDTQAEQAAGDMVKANEELEVAVTTARKTRKKKWICLGICVAIVVIIVVAVVAYIMVNRAANGGGGGNNNNNQQNNQENNNNNGGQKRSLFGRSISDNLQMNTARAVKIAAEQPAARGIDIAGIVNRAAAGSIAPPTRLTKRRRVDKIGIAFVKPNSDVESAVKRRFVVDWEGPETKGSDE